MSHSHNSQAPGTPLGRLDSDVNDLVIQIQRRAQASKGPGRRGLRLDFGRLSAAVRGGRARASR